MEDAIEIEAVLAAAIRCYRAKGNGPPDPQVVEAIRKWWSAHPTVIQNKKDEAWSVADFVAKTTALMSNASKFSVKE